MGTVWVPLFPAGQRGPGGSVWVSPRPQTLGSLTAPASARGAGLGGGWGAVVGRASHPLRLPGRAHHGVRGLRLPHGLPAALWLQQRGLHLPPGRLRPAVVHAHPGLPALLPRQPHPRWRGEVGRPCSPRSAREALVHGTPVKPWPSSGSKTQVADPSVDFSSGPCLLLPTSVHTLSHTLSHSFKPLITQEPGGGESGASGKQTGRFGGAPGPRSGSSTLGFVCLSPKPTSSSHRGRGGVWGGAPLLRGKNSDAQHTPGFLPGAAPPGSPVRPSLTLPVPPPA